MKPLHTLSIRQPWAQLVVDGHKNVENRSWDPPRRFIGQRIRIHAGKQRDAEGLQEAVDLWDYLLVNEGDHDAANRMRAARQAAAAMLERPPVHTGALLGEATLAKVVQHATSPWFFGPYGFVLTDPVAYKHPVRCRGRLGFFVTP